MTTTTTSTSTGTSGRGRGREAVVIGAGPNGLVAANMLVDAGWDVLVLEAQQRVGGVARRQAIDETGDCVLHRGAERDERGLRAPEQASARLRAAAQRLADRVRARPVQRAEKDRQRVQFGDVEAEVDRAPQTGLPRQPFVARVARQSPSEA